MEHSRRDVLRAGGALLATASVAGCIEERVTQRETFGRDTSAWTLSPATGNALDAQEFENYVERMTDRYGDSGVWGLSADRPDTFDTAYVQRYAVTRATPGSPTTSESSLAPETIEPEAPVLFADASIARYEAGNDRYRYWLWIASDPTDGRLVRDVSLTELSNGIRLKRGAIGDASTPSTDDGEASVGLESPPSGTFPLRGGSVDTTSVRGAEGTYVTEWTGELDDRQSVNGVCEVDREGDFELFWTISLGYNFEETL